MSAAATRGLLAAVAALAVPAAGLQGTASMDMMAQLGVAGAHAAAVSREATAQQFLLLPGHFEGIRISLQYPWFDDPLHTCQQASPASVQRASTNNKVPLAYYAPQPPRSIMVYNRRGGGVPLQRSESCVGSNILSESQKSFLRTRALPQVVEQLANTVAPHLKGSGGPTPIAGNHGGTNQQMRCHNDHFVFNLTAPFAFPGRDLVVFITAEPGNQPAYAFPCQFALDGRPTVVVLNIAPNKMHAVGTVPRGAEKLHAHILQAFVHALGFDPSLFFQWRQGSKNITVPAGASGTHMLNVMGSPAVKQWVNTQHFRCAGHPKGGTGTLAGAELEDALDPSGRPLPFWESRLFRGEVMTMLPDLAQDRSLSVPVLSGLTLALLSDTGWYAVNAMLAQPLTWLRDQPCSRATDPCTAWPHRYACTPQEVQPLCSADFTAVAPCSAVEWPAGAIPDKFRRDGSRVNWGGTSRLMDFCPVRDGGVSQGSCLFAGAGDPDCQNGKCVDYQVRGATSRCFEATLHYTAFSGGGAEKGRCIPHECVRVGTPALGQPQVWHVVLLIGGRRYTCDGSAVRVGPGDGAGAGVAVCGGDTLKGTVACPTPAELCEEASSETVEKACDPLQDCGGRGVCNAGACVCFSELGPDGLPLYGMYAGARCERCAEGYYGAQCKDRKCSVDPVSKAMCYGHGNCLSGACTCHANDTFGHWDTATACSTCATGYTGGSCKLRACDPASTTSCGKGACDATTLRCVCYTNNAQGYWQRGAGGVCDRCLPGYDVYGGCKTAIASFFGCVAATQTDSLLLNPCRVDCTPGDAVPRRVTTLDERGCAFDSPAPECKRARCKFAGRSGNVTGSRPGAPSGCPTPSFVPYDCQGFPNLYHDCWELDECGCESPKRPQCVVGTDAVPSPDAYNAVANVRTPAGGADQRTAAAPTSTKKCACPAPSYLPMYDCWGPLEANASMPGGVQIRQVTQAVVKGRVVVFEPEQLFEEDFCHCTSPPIPRCNDVTRPEWLPERAQGKLVSCGAILKKYGCPDWDNILNTGGRRNASEPDYTLVDCDGWPAPKLRTSKDPCGCPLPQFRCLPGTMGVCADPPDCPQWDPLPPVNCVDQMPPVPTMHAPHPCGCPPPPAPSCIPGTQRSQCLCEPKGNNNLDGTPCSADDIEWVDCKGVPLEAPAWSPHRYYPKGDPFINTCDPCPQCVPPRPLRRCLEGTSSPLPAVADSGTRLCPSSGFDPTGCPRFPPPCPVDCQGRPPPDEKEYDPLCECPPSVPTPPCLPGTDGAAPDASVRSAPCASTPQLCGGYACGGGGHDVERLAADLGFAGDYSAQARERVLAAAAAATRYCVQEGQCGSHYHCAPGYSCGPCGLCLSGPPRPATGCLADRGASCGLYRCEVTCDGEQVAAVKAGLRDARCLTRCLTDADCTDGALCSFGAYSPRGRTGAAWRGEVRVMGRADLHGLKRPPKGIPGYNPHAVDPPSSVVEVRHGYVPLSEYGECVVPEQPDRQAVMYCYSHDDCGAYACGASREQTMFAQSRCASSCWVNAHCHPDARCVRATGTCVRTAYSGSAAGGMPPRGGRTLPDGASCSLHPHNHCAPYWCGGRRALPPEDGAVCPTGCRSDEACQPFHRCVFETLDELRERHGSAAYEATCDAATGVRVAAEKDVRAAQMLRHPEAGAAGVGRCVPVPALRRRTQTAGDMREQREASPAATLPWLFPAVFADTLLAVPVGGVDGRPTDPNAFVFRHAPFAPPVPPPPPPPGTAVSAAASACHPYVAVARGVTLSQIVQMRLTATAGSLDHNTGTYFALPVCKTYCRGDADCVGGYFCTAPAPTAVFTSAAGNKVVSGGGDPDLGMQGSDEDAAGRGDDAASSEIALWKNRCQARRGLGAACGRGLECASGHCWRGVCCNTACAGACRTCERMGVCGWAVPHTSPPGACPTCSWCEYVRGPDGSVSPSAALECAPAPEGQDPGGSCGPHATCNGEGGCTAAEGWGGRGNTCAAGFSGPNCIDESVHFRTVAVPEAYSAVLCTVDDVLRLASSPSVLARDRGRTYASVRSGTGMAGNTDYPPSFMRRFNVVDRRPRQWAQRVLRVSSHSRYGCSNILYEPSRGRSARAHGETPDAWAPGQFVAAAPGLPSESPEKEYFPFLICGALATQGSCVAEAACAWAASPSPGYCTAARSARGFRGAAALSPDSTAYDAAGLAPQPLEFIELEFETPVDIEAVILHENFHPGSLVRIETQPALEGSAAMADAGGGAYATHPDTGEEVPPSTVVAPMRVGGTTPVTSCGALTKQGMAVCVLDPGCFWLSGECRVARSPCLNVGEETCRQREEEGRCHWDVDACAPGRRSGCYAAAGYDAAAFSALCGAFNDRVAYPDARREEADRLCNADARCQTGQFVADACVANDVACSTQSGKFDLCGPPCLYNSSTAECTDGPFPNGWTRVQFCQTVTNAQQCGRAVQCDWVVDAALSGCQPVRAEQCAGSEADACQRAAACEWVEPAARAPPPKLFTAGCPPLPEYNNTAASRYVEQNARPVVGLTCREGYEQDGVQECDTATGNLTGSTACVEMVCSDYPPGPGMLVSGYTAAPPFAERQQHSTPILSCVSGRDVAGAAPSCQNGAWFGMKPSCEGDSATGQRRAGSVLESPWRVKVNCKYSPFSPRANTHTHTHTHTRRRRTTPEWRPTCAPGVSTQTVPPEKRLHYSNQRS